MSNNETPEQEPVKWWTGDPPGEPTPEKPAPSRAPTRAESDGLRRADIRAAANRRLAEEAAKKGTFKDVFPTAATTAYSVSLPNYPMTIAASEPEVVPPVEEGRLATLAHDINTRFTLADRNELVATKHRVAAAIYLAEAKKLCEANKINFKAWASVSVPQAYDTVRKLAYVGASENPTLALEDMRIKNAITNKRMRARRKQQAEQSNPFAPASETASAEETPAVEVLPPGVEASLPAPEPTPAVEEPPVADEAAQQHDEEVFAQMEAKEQRSQDDIAHDLIDSIPLLDAVQRRLVADKATAGLPAKETRELVTSLAERVGLKVTRAKGSNFFASADTLMADFETLGASDKADFLKAAAESVGIAIEVPV